MTQEVVLQYREEASSSSEWTVVNAHALILKRKGIVPHIHNNCCHLEDRHSSFVAGTFQYGFKLTDVSCMREILIGASNNRRMIPRAPLICFESDVL